VKGSAALKPSRAIGGPFETCCDKRRPSATPQIARSRSAKQPTTQLLPRGAPASPLLSYYKLFRFVLSRAAQKIVDGGGKFERMGRRTTTKKAALP
jgi:hypothetical protein